MAKHTIVQRKEPLQKSSKEVTNHWSFPLARLCPICTHRYKLDGMTRTKTTKAPKESEQVKENTGKMGEQVGRRAQTTSYRKEKELRRGAGASQTGCELKEGAGKYDSTNLAGQQLATRISQAHVVEPSSTDATESDRGE
ncbi:hypothetical protein Scep_022106 [Stephania cephalantha]|uniref:Uncharacterized protein n=1 Tax=Stephania cephalantha TaxID=152367 RepID=A0AAP0F7D8_9MAGN